MTRRARLMATLDGRPVDRPAVSFYEIDGLNQNPEDTDPFNIYADPSWCPLIQLARDRTDRIVARPCRWRRVVPGSPHLVSSRTYIRNGSRFAVKTIEAAGRTLACRTRRDPDVNTVWVEEPLLKDAADLEAYLELPAPQRGDEPDVAPALDAEARLGDSGIVMIDVGDPLCAAASLFSMEEFTVVAMTQEDLFLRLLDRFAPEIYERVEAMAKALPGRLWRIVGPEYATCPYLPPRLFRKYVVDYDRPMIKAIQRFGGYARVHCHGRLRDVLDLILELKPDGLDPIEPPPQGDVELRLVRERCGKDIVLFGNIEVSDLEILPAAAFAEKVERALHEGTSGAGRGFVLMPSACPFGRKLSPKALQNYEIMVDMAERFHLAARLGF